jgi:hypothetical protein
MVVGPEPCLRPMASTGSPHTFAAMINPIIQFAARLTAACLLVVVVSGVGHLIINPGTDASSPVGEAVTALIEGTGLTTVPPGFEEAMRSRSDSPAKSDGSCSTPSSYPAFAEACRTHDLGYDLLRFASATGEPLGPWARLGIDRRFHRDMITACDNLGCRVLAHLYGFGVGLNSVRQGFTTPTEEPIEPWAMAGLLTVAVTGTSTFLVPTTGHRRRVESPALGASLA